MNAPGTADARDAMVRPPVSVLTATAPRASGGTPAGSFPDARPGGGSTGLLGVGFEPVTLLNEGVYRLDEPVHELIVGWIELFEPLPGERHRGAKQRAEILSARRRRRCRRVDAAIQRRGRDFDFGQPNAAFRRAERIANDGRW